MPQPKPLLVLHAGAFKTGTSTLQSLFSLYGAEIAERFGVHYPKVFRRVNSGSIIEGHPRVDSVAHHMIAHLLRQEGAGARLGLALQFDAMAEAFRESGCRSVLLSTELLSFCPREFKAFLVEQLAGFDLRVIYAVRNPIDYIESINNQTLKSGERVRRREGEGPSHVPFRANIEEWAELLGPERVRVIAFSTAGFADFCRRFFDVFEDPGLTAFALERMPRTNGSISVEGARVRMMLNAYLPRPRLLGRKRRHTITRLVSDLDARLEHRTPLVTLDSAERQATLAQNRADVDAICDRYLPRETWTMFLAPERGLVARRTPLDAAVFTARDMDRIAACLVRARSLVSPEEDGKTAARSDDDEA